MLVALMSRERQRVPDAIIAAAMSDGFIVGFFVHAHVLLPIVEGGEAVGFYRPHAGPFGRQIGPIFVAPKHRRRGVALRLYNATPGELYARVEERNAPSVALHESACFTRWRRFGCVWYWRRLP
jgi:GNAT superfamily N-acetyltransferase